MKRRLKSQLKSQMKMIYEAPVPPGKEAFLQKIERMEKKEWRQEEELSCWKVLGIQIGYIRKWNWLVSVLFFAAVIVAEQSVTGRTLWGLSAFVPYLALMVVAEGLRSTRYRMEELELASRFSVKYILLARLGALGLFQLCLLLLLMPFLYTIRREAILEIGIHILLPWLSTVFVMFLMIRKMHGRESHSLCVGTAVIVSGACLTFGIMNVSMFDLAGAGVWTLLLVSGAVLAGREVYQFIRQSEELQWN